MAKKAKSETKSKTDVTLTEEQIANNKRILSEGAGDLDADKTPNFDDAVAERSPVGYSFYDETGKISILSKQAEEALFAPNEPWDPDASHLKKALNRQRQKPVALTDAASKKGEFILEHLEAISRDVYEDLYNEGHIVQIRDNSHIDINEETIRTFLEERYTKVEDGVSPKVHKIRSMDILFGDRAAEVSAPVQNYITRLIRDSLETTLETHYKELMPFKDDKGFQK